MPIVPLNIHSAKRPVHGLLTLLLDLNKTARFLLTKPVIFVLKTTLSRTNTANFLATTTNFNATLSREFFTSNDYRDFKLVQSGADKFS